MDSVHHSRLTPVHPVAARVARGHSAQMVVRAVKVLLDGLSACTPHSVPPLSLKRNVLSIHVTVILIHVIFSLRSERGREATPPYTPHRITSKMAHQNVWFSHPVCVAHSFEQVILTCTAQLRQGLPSVVGIHDAWSREKRLACDVTKRFCMGQCFRALRLAPLVSLLRSLVCDGYTKLRRSFALELCSSTFALSLLKSFSLYHATHVTIRY